MPSVGSTCRQGGCQTFTARARRTNGPEVALVLACEGRANCAKGDVDALRRELARTVAAGNFLYIGASALAPEVNKAHSLRIGLLHLVSFCEALRCSWRSLPSQVTWHLSSGANFAQTLRSLGWNRALCAPVEASWLRHVACVVVIDESHLQARPRWADAECPAYARWAVRFMMTLLRNGRSSWSPRRGALAVVLFVGTLLTLVGLAGPASAATPDIIMWGHPGCPHCRAAHAYFDGLRARRPELVVVEHDVSQDEAAFAELRAQSERAGVDMVGVPSFLVRGTFLVGFDSAETTGTNLEALLAPQANPSRPEHGPAHAPGSDEPRTPGATSRPIAGEGELNLPWFGGVSVRKLGLPLFTIAVGLVDGFNPCAMWVLLFLLALLVNVKNRARMLAIAGTFVIVSGLAYFAFMAAWLNVFQLVGLSRPVELVLGSVALLIGAVNIKDFIAFGKGFSFSIPEKAKPGIYARVRAIVRAEKLGAALVGATVLALLVNVIELVCTAGLPALYTQVLAQHGVSTGARYAYLGLYNLAYMFDDSLMVGIAVVTLGRRKLQERTGRWLKLLSGIAIAVLGLLLLVAPQSLAW